MANWPISSGGQGPKGNTGAAGAAGAAGPAGPGPTIVYKTADQTVNNSTTYVSDTHLTVPTLTASKKYKVTVVARVTDASVLQASGMKFKLAGTATFTYALGRADVTDPALLTLAVSDRLTSASQEETFSGVQFPDVLIDIEVECSGTGTLIFQWAQATASIADLTVLRGSYLTYQEVA